MIVGYKEALEMTVTRKGQRRAHLNNSQKKMVLNTIPYASRVSADWIAGRLIHRGITKGQVCLRLRIEFEAGTINKYPMLSDGRRKEYQRKDVLG